MDEIPRINAPHPFKMHPTFGNDHCIYGLRKDRGGVSCGRPLDDPIHAGLPIIESADPSDWGWARVEPRGAMSPLEALAELRAEINRGIGQGIFDDEDTKLLDIIERELRR
jgi:hypothetical protein